MYELKVVTKFAAAHQLAMVGEKCENLHGHNWKIEVYVAGDHTDAAGVLLDFGAIKKHVRAITNFSMISNSLSKISRLPKTSPTSWPQSCKKGSQTKARASAGSPPGNPMMRVRPILFELTLTVDN